MYSFSYVYSGPKQSLLACSSVVTINLDSLKERSDIWVPSIKHIYTPYSRLLSSKQSRTYAKNKIFYFSTLLDEELNKQGDYAISKTIYKHIEFAVSQSIVLYDTEKNAYHKRISKPKEWYERLCVGLAVLTRHDYLIHIYRNNHFPPGLENDLDKQLNLLLSYKALPMIFDWQKCMKAVKDIYPKPKWWHKEMDRYNSIVNGEG